MWFVEVRNYICICLICMNFGYGRCVNDVYIEFCGVCDIVLKKKKD